MLLDFLKGALRGMTMISGVTLHVGCRAGLVFLHFDILLFALLLSQKGYYRAMLRDFRKRINKGSGF